MKIEKLKTHLETIRELSPVVMNEYIHRNIEIADQEDIILKINEIIDIINKIIV